MRVRVIRWTDPTTSIVKLCVERWCAGQWESVPGAQFQLNESERANEFAMKLSLTKRVPVETAMFEDGKKVEPLKFPTYHIESQAYTCTEQVPENQS